MSTGKVLLAVTGGLLAGAALGVLFAPAKGEDTRGNIGKAAKKLSDDISDKLEEGTKAISDMKDQVKDLAAQIKKSVLA